MEKWTRARFLPGLPLGKDGRRVTASKEHIEIAKDAAKEGMVLLKNEKKTLPLAEGTKIALFGKATFDYVKGGGGSGDVTVPYIRNIYDGLLEVVDPATIFPDSAAYYKAEVEKQYAEGKVPGMVVEPVVPGDILKKARAFTDTAIISISRFSGEGWDRKSTDDHQTNHAGREDGGVWDMCNAIFEHGDFYLSDAEAAMMQKVTEAFDKVIVVLNTGGMIETASLKENEKVGAVLLAWQGGIEGGLAAAELIMGKGNPSGKLNDTFARRLEDYPGSATYFESDDYVNYFEDIYVGYRYFETIPGMAEKVVYPFGYGLSYTTFALGQPSVVVADGQVTACVKVTNTGEYAGKEVVQVYVEAPQGKLGKPARVLAGFRKTHLLQPGDEQNVIIRFPISQLASYDDLGKVQKSAWVLEQGEYKFHIGTSVRDTVLAETTYTESSDRVVEQLSEKMAPARLEKRLLSDGSYEELPTWDQPMAEPADRGYLQPATRAVPAIDRRFMDKPQLIDVVNGKTTLEELIAAMSDEDLAHLMGGQPNTGAANTFGYGNNEVFGIPNIMTEDGPAGVRFHKVTGLTATAFPCSTLLACSWDPEVCEKIGRTGALEAKENNIGVWLTPAVCIHRNPLCGRNFEYYSEDPLLAGKLASAMVRGIQSQHIAATPKHLALNNKEFNRKNSDSRASERAIREIYLKQFEIIVKESHPWSIMSSYNIINGHRASENKDMLIGILRDEWGWDGMITTDWWTYGLHAQEAMAGNDMKMGLGFPEELMAALEEGTLTREAMETCAKHILTLIMRID